MNVQRSLASIIMNALIIHIQSILLAAPDNVGYSLIKMEDVTE